VAVEVLVIGGGVAALETAAALHALAGSRVETTLVAPATHFQPRALSVNAPFGGQTLSISLPELAHRIPFHLRQGELDGVDPEQHAVRLRDGERRNYDIGNPERIIRLRKRRSC
jgi:sulfide:quinone oxidoreductase